MEFKMKKISLQKKLNASAFAFVVALSATSYSHAHECKICETYVGLDAVYNVMKFKTDFGGNIFAKKGAPGLNVFVGHMFHEHFGAELGFEVEKKMKRTETIPAGQKVNGFPVGAVQRSESYNTEVTQNHPYLGLIGRINIVDNSVASLLVGVSASHIKAKQNLFSIGGAATNVTETFSKTKFIPIVRASIEHKFNDKFGVRALAAWKNTSQFKLNPKEGGTDQVKLKNSFSFGLGAMYYIF
jgi:hypothetical protein